jgi:flagellar protein FlbD
MKAMIVVTRLDRRPFAINPDLIERISSNPDTTLHMVDGSTYIVEEPLQDIIGLIADYRARVIRLARDMTSTPAGNGPALSVVRPADRAAAPSPDSGQQPSRK